MRIMATSDLHGNLEGINPKGADGRSGQANGKAKIKLRMCGGEPAESIGESKWRCHRETM
jgi:hypothetical protein